MWAQKQEFAIERASRPLLNMSASRDLQTSPQIVHMHKSCIEDDDKVLPLDVCKFLIFASQSGVKIIRNSHYICG